MAVPKRRKSKAQTKMRKSQWKRKAADAALKAISLGKSISTRNAKGFFYEPSPILVREPAFGFSVVKDSQLNSAEQEDS